MLRILLAASLATLSVSIVAEPNQAVQFDHGFVSAGYDWIDVEGADFDGTVGAEIGARWTLNDLLLLEAGLSGIFDSQTETLEDNTGSYQLSISSWDFLLGIQYQQRFAERLAGYVRLGALAYNMEIELDEAFYDLKPAGSDSASDNGFGFYGGVGATYLLNPGWSISSELLFKRRLDFLDESSKPFDVDSTGFSIGLRHAF
ncbi:MAG: outer membrane beta-barrel protein [Pseudomonadota bacterium]|nr:outer membrane beta-barrel protein [Pseudomonadota bacterium]